MKRLITTVALALSVGLTACDTDRVTSPNAGLAMEVAISDASIGPGETATISYRLRNVGNVRRTVRAGCGTMVAYIEDENGASVFPPGPVICALVALPPVTLAPGEEIAGSIRVTRAPAAASGGSPIGLPPGRYTAYARFSGAAVDVRWVLALRVRSPEVPFEITS